RRGGFNVHGFGFGFAFLEDDFGFGFPLSANRRRVPFGFRNQALLLGGGQRFDALTLDLGLLQHGRDQFLFAAVDFRVLDFDLSFLFDLLHPHAFGGDLLLHDVGLNVVGLVGLRLLLLRDFKVLRFLDLEVALRFSLLGLGERLRQHALLVGLRSRNRRFTGCHGALDGGVALGFGGGDVSIALDPGNVGLAHVGDVFVLVFHFLDGERDHLQAHLVHVVGAGGAHAVAHHLGLLDDFFHGELSDDPAQMAFHHQTNQAFALLIGLGEELLGRGINRFGVGLHLDLRNRLDGYGDALFGIEILLWSDVKRHELERQIMAVLDHGEHDRSMTGDYALAAKAINNQRFMWSRFAV